MGDTNGRGHEVGVVWGTKEPDFTFSQANAGRSSGARGHEGSALTSLRTSLSREQDITPTRSVTAP